MATGKPSDPLVAWDVRSGVLRSALWLGCQALQIGVLIPGWTLAAFLGMAIGFAAFLADPRQRRPRTSWMLLPLAIPPAILVIGAAFWKGGPADTSSDRLVALIDWLTWCPALIGLGLLACFRSRSAWLMIFGIVAGATWFSFGSAFMSIMAVTNVWL